MLSRACKPVRQNGPLGEILEGGGVSEWSEEDKCHGRRKIQQPEWSHNHRDASLELSTPYFGVFCSHRDLSSC